MSQLDREGLISQSNFLFPDNTTREITPADLRTFNTDVADSLQLTGSNVISASYADASGFASSSDWSGINNIPSGLVSSSSQISDITGSSIIGASIVNATTTYEKGDTTTFDLTVDNVDNALSASQAESSNTAISASHSEFSDEARDLIVSVKNTTASPIAKGIAVHATGVTGENINVILADSSDSNAMPAIGITNETIGANGVGNIVISGKIIGIDTANDGLIAGSPIYVNGSGVISASKPTGSDLIQNIGVCGKVNAVDGEIIVMGAGRTNDLPNLQEGYYWVGDSNGVPQPQLSQSVDVGVTSIIAGTNISIDQGTGDVTVSAPITASEWNDILNKPAGLVSGSSQLTSSYDTRYEQRGSGIVSSSAQITPLLPTGTISGSTQVIELLPTGTVSGSDQVLGGTGIVSSSAQITPLLPTGTVSGSSQVSYPDLSNIPSGIVSGSDQVTSSLDTRYAVLNGDNIFVGNQIISGSTKTETQVLTITSLTASLDFNQTDMHELTLVASTDTHLTATNVGKGQTINVLVKQASGGSGTLSFDTEFLQPSGSSYTATSDANAEDILTLVTFNDTNKIYVAAVNKLQ